MRVGVLTHPHPCTTGRYLERAIEAEGHQLVRMTSIEPAFDLGPEDLLLAVDPFFRPWPIGLERLACRTATYLIDVHVNLWLRSSAAHFFDYVFVAQKDLVSAVAKSGAPHVEWLPLGCDLELHCVSGLPRETPVGFVGKLGVPGSERFEVLSRVLNAFPTNDFLRFHLPLEMGEAYSRSRIVFNKSINADVNMRVFEAWASGALLVTDRVENGLSDLAREGVHYVGYSTADEAETVICRYLDDELARARIAAAGQQNARDHHTYRHRWLKIASALAANPTARSPARDRPAQDAFRRSAELMAHVGAPIGDVRRLIASPGVTPAGAGKAAVALARSTSQAARAFLARRQ